MIQLEERLCKEQSRELAIPLGLMYAQPIKLLVPSVMTRFPESLCWRELILLNCSLTSTLALWLVHTPNVK